MGEFVKEPVKRKVMSDEFEICACSVKKKNKRNYSPSDRELESWSAYSKKYRARLKEERIQLALENKKLQELNDRLLSERAELRAVITKHMKKCPDAADLKDLL